MSFFFWYGLKKEREEKGKRACIYITRVDEVVRVVVVADGARLRLVELGVLDFFELDHGFFFGLGWTVVGEVDWGRGGALMGVGEGKGRREWL